jgi:hypothetical protein
MSSSGKRILERDGHFMNVADAADGKLILLITTTESGVADGFTIGLNPTSLADLRAAAHSGTFTWEIRDGSLRIEGHDTGWVLLFTMTSPPFSRAKLSLTTSETARFRAEILGGSVH